MTTEIKKKELSLSFIWSIRCKLWAEGNKLWAEGDKLRAEGNKLWAEAILGVYGNIKLEHKWRPEKNDYACVLETGEIFEP